MRTINELLNLHGRVALVTGGAGHLGSVMAETLAELDASLVILDRDWETCQTAVSRLASSTGCQTMPLSCDLALEEEISKVPQQVLDRFGRLDILVHCAGFVGAMKLPGWGTAFNKQPPSIWKEALQVNLTAVFALTQACAAALKTSGHSSVINIASIYGMVGPDMRLYEGLEMGNTAVYAAGKGGLLQLTRWLATVMAPDVRVNSITPGGVWRNQPELFVQRYENRTPLRRMGCEEDFKGAVAFLASDASAYMTGQNLVIDGGWTVW